MGEEMYFPSKNLYLKKHPFFERWACWPFAHPATWQIPPKVPRPPRDGMMRLVMSNNLYRSFRV